MANTAGVPLAWKKPRPLSVVTSDQWLPASTLASRASKLQHAYRQRKINKHASAISFPQSSNITGRNTLEARTFNSNSHTAYCVTKVEHVSDMNVGRKKWRYCICAAPHQSALTCRWARPDPPYTKSLSECCRSYQPVSRRMASSPYSLAPPRCD